LFYLCIYLISVIGIFNILLGYRKNTNSDIDNISELGLISSSDTFISNMLIINLLSLSGIPPLLGFFGKLFIFEGLFYTYNNIIVLVLFIFSVISSVYYLRIIRFLIFDNHKTINPIRCKMTSLQMFLIVIISIMNFFLIIFQEYLISELYIILF